MPAVSSSAAASRQQVSQWQTASPYDGTCPTGYVLGSWKAHNQWHTQRQDKRQKAGEDGPLPLPSSDALPAEARGVSRSGALSGADRPAGRTTLDSGAWVAASHLVAGSHRADTTQTGTATATQPFFCVPSYTGGGRSLRRHNMAAGYCPAPQASARPHRPLTHCLVADPRGMEGVEHDDPLWARVVRTGDQRCVDEPTNPPPPLPTVTTTAAGSPPCVSRCSWHGPACALCALSGGGDDDDFTSSFLLQPGRRPGTQREDTEQATRSRTGWCPLRGRSASTWWRQCDQRE